MIDPAARANRLHTKHREALQMMGEEAEDTCDGFGIEPLVMRDLVRMGYVNLDDTDARRIKYWLNRDGLAVHQVIVKQNERSNRDRGD